MKNVLIFIPTLTAGGAERVASILANEWQSYVGTKVTVVTLFRAEVFYPLSTRIEHVCLNLGARKGCGSRALELLYGLRRLRATVMRRRPRFVLSFMNKYNVYCIVALLCTGMRVVAAERDSPTEKLSLLRVLLRKLTYPMAALILVQSQAAKQFMLSTTKSRQVEVLLNPVEAIVNSGERCPQRFILNVSRLHPKKGQMDLLEAFSRLDVPGWNLVLCGDGPLRDELIARAEKLGISPRTKFVGTIANIRPLLQTAGVFVLTSYWEGFPNALAEAMVSGVACVSYDCPTGPSELIEHGVNGLLVSVGDVNGLTDALRAVMLNDQLAKALAASATQVRAKVDKSSVARMYWDVCMSRSKQL